MRLFSGMFAWLRGQRARSSGDELWDETLAALVAEDVDQRFNGVLACKVLMDMSPQDRRRVQNLLILFIRVYKSRAYDAAPPIDLRAAAHLLDTGQLPTSEQVNGWVADAAADNNSNAFEPTLVLSEGRVETMTALDPDGVIRCLHLRAVGQLHRGDGSIHTWRVLVPPELITDYAQGVISTVRRDFPDLGEQLRLDQ